MSKRKRRRDELDDLSRKVRKLQRKLERKKRSRSRSRSRSYKRSRRSRAHSSSSRRSRSRDAAPTPPPRYHTGEYESESRTRSPSPVDDVIPCDVSSAVVAVETVPATDKPSPCDQEPVLGNNDHPEESNSQQKDSTGNDTVLPVEQAIDSELLEILGEDPSSKPQFGKELQKDLASRLEHIATIGLDKEIRKELSNRYLIPSNCTLIAAPQLNPEIRAALPELTLKRDKGIEHRQNQLTSAITCLGQAITTQLQSNEKNNQLLKLLMDAIRILCDVQHTDSLKRRYFASSSLKKDINDQLLPTKIDKFLFGENLAEALKAAKAVSKSGAEIKVSASGGNKNFKKPPQPQPSTSKGLNWRGPPPARRLPPPTGARTRQPPPPAPQKKLDYSSRASQHHSKQNRRH